jgi:hypothetical protein
LRESREKVLGDSGAHHGAVELVGEAVDGLEKEIDGGRASASRARRRRLGASQLVWLDKEKDKTMAELQSISWELGVSSSDGAGTWLGLRFQW